MNKFVVSYDLHSKVDGIKVGLKKTISTDTPDKARTHVTK